LQRAPAPITIVVCGDDPSRLSIARPSMASIISDWEKRMQRKRMTPEFRRRLEQRRAESARNVAEIGEIFACREQRLREWDEYVARRRARLRRVTFGLLGR
jgi:hypothetical protein